MPSPAVVILTHRVRHVEGDVEAHAVGQQRLFATESMFLAHCEHDRHQQYGLMSAREVIEVLRVAQRAVRHRGVDRIGFYLRAQHACDGFAAELVYEAGEDLPEWTRGAVDRASDCV